MGLTNSQYDELMRRYSRQQTANARALSERREEVYSRCPQFRTLDEQMGSLALQSFRASMAGNRQEEAALRSRMRENSLQRSEALRALGYPVDYLQMRYHCRDCQDTGYIGQQKCHCFRRYAIELFYTDSGLAQVVQKENFDHFRLDYYPDDVPDTLTGLTPRENMRRILEQCHTFLRSFDKEGGSLLFYGGTGLGKTFLSHCIARELIESAHSVIYYSAFDFFERLARETFYGDAPTDRFHEYLQGCDLLIIDDLGTEMTNAFVLSRLFLILNERISRGRSTLVSTNLSLEDFAGVYSERIFSRITSSFTILHFYGNDIRLLRKLQGIH